MCSYVDSLTAEVSGVRAAPAQSDYHKPFLKPYARRCLSARCGDAQNSQARIMIVAFKPAKKNWGSVPSTPPTTSSKYPKYPRDHKALNGGTLGGPGGPLRCLRRPNWGLGVAYKSLSFGLEELHLCCLTWLFLYI